MEGDLLGLREEDRRRPVKPQVRWSKRRECPHPGHPGADADGEHGVAVVAPGSLAGPPPGLVISPMRGPGGDAKTDARRYPSTLGSARRVVTNHHPSPFHGRPSRSARAGRRPGRRRRPGRTLRRRAGGGEPVRAGPGPDHRDPGGQPRSVRHVLAERVLAERVLAEHDRLRRRRHLLSDQHQRGHLRRHRDLAGLHRRVVQHQLARATARLARLRGDRHRDQHPAGPAGQPRPATARRVGLPGRAQLGAYPDRQQSTRGGRPLDGRRREPGGGVGTAVAAGRGAARRGTPTRAGPSSGCPR